MYPVIAGSSQAHTSSKRIIHFSTWDGTDFLFKGSCKLPRSNSGRKQSMSQFSRCFPNNYLVGFSKLPQESRLGSIYDSRFTDDETEDEKRQGHRARGPEEKVGADHRLHIIAQLSSHQSTLYLAKLTFHETTLIVVLCEYIHTYQSNSIMYSCIFISHSSL